MEHIENPNKKASAVLEREVAVGRAWHVHTPHPRAVTNRYGPFALR